MVILDLILELHNLARTTEPHDLRMRIRLIADELAKIGNELYTRENEDKLCTLEEAETFAKKRNYEWDEWKANKDIV